MFRSSKTPWANRNVNNYKYEKFHMPRWQGAGGIHRKYERGMGLVNTEVKTNVNTTVEDNYMDSLKSSEIFNDTENYESTSVKDTALQEYVTNITNKRETNDEMARNLSNNLNTVANVIQDNEMDIEIGKNAELEDVEFLQSNEEHKKIANILSSFYEDVLKVIRDNETEQGEEKDVENNRDLDFGTSNDTSQGATATQSSDMSADQTVAQSASNETFHKPRWQGANGFHRKYERGMGLVNTEVSTNVNTGITNTTQLSKDFSHEENINYNTVKNDTELFSKISDAYDSLISTINNTKTSLTQANSSDMEANTEQTNKMIVKIGSGTNMKNTTFEQKNAAIVEMSAALTVQSILNSGVEDIQKAIMLDMLGATNNFSETANDLYSNLDFPISFCISSMEALLKFT